MLGLLAALLVLLAAGIAWTWQPDRPLSALAPRWAPPPSQFIGVDGMQVHYRDQGPRDDPVPIVLIHGTSASLHTWQGWTAALSVKRRVISMDLPAFGLTGPNPTGDYRTDTYVAFVLHFLDALHVQHFVVAGNSLGGNIAWRLADVEPARVERLILVDAAGYPFKSSEVPLGFRIARTPGINRILKHILPRSLIEASVRNVYGDPARVTPELVDRYFELALREGNREALGQEFAQFDPGASAERIKAVKQPTLILWGGLDHLIPPDNAQNFQRDIAGSKLVMFDDLGHVPQEEDPARSVAAVQAFLNP